MRDRFSVGRVISGLGKDIREELHLGAYEDKVLRALSQCRTAALGGHVDVCPECGCMEISYNSCRNRHCPLCQGHAREKWIAARKRDVLPVKYYHVVFTLPDKLNPLILSHKKELYSLLFKAAWQTLGKFFRNKGLQGSMIALLHTWGSNLQFHPHLHCIVPAGGMDGEGKWRHLPGAGNDTPYLFPVKAMSKVFRAKYLALFPQEIKPQGHLRKILFEKEWVVYCKRPMKVGTVIDYLGRYSHRIAITNRRITHVDEENVRFTCKDYKQQGINKEMTLSPKEFLRRFCLHILPPGFVRIRHYGFLASSNKAKLEQIKQQTGIQKESRVQADAQSIEKEDANELHPNSYLCPHCKKAYMVCIKIIPSASRSPPVSLTFS